MISTRTHEELVTVWWLNLVSHNYLVTPWKSDRHFAGVEQCWCCWIVWLYIPLCPLHFPHHCLDTYKCPAPVPHFLVNADKIVQITWMCSLAILQRIFKMISSLFYQEQVMILRFLIVYNLLLILQSQSVVQLYSIGTSNCRFHIFAKHVSEDIRLIITATWYVTRLMNETFWYFVFTRTVSLSRSMIMFCWRKHDQPGWPKYFYSLVKMFCLLWLRHKSDQLVKMIIYDCYDCGDKTAR